MQIILTNSDIGLSIIAALGTLEQAMRQCDVLPK